jgi:hypothetical protein
MSRSVTSRLPNSILEWYEEDATTWWRKHVGQSGQPRPELVSRTASPVKMMAIIEMNEASANQRKTGPVTRRRVEAGIGPA